MLSENTFALTEHTPRPLHPKAVLILHTTGCHDTVNAVTHHELQGGVIQQGIALNKAQLLEAIGEEKVVEFTWIEPTTLLDNTHKAVWYRKAMRRQMHFSTDKGKVQFTVKFPATLFIFTKKTNSFQLFALANDDRPTPNTLLYMLPVGNVSSNGTLCLGGGASYIPDVVKQSNFSQVERCFFQAISTHTNTQYLFKKCLNKKRITAFSNVINYWQKHAEKDTKPSVKRDFIEVGKLHSMVAGKING